MFTTIVRQRCSPKAFVFLLLVAALASCQGYQPLAFQSSAARFASPRRTSPTTTRLSVGADFDSDFEAALGQGQMSEYERDAEFYRKRNEAYYKRKDEDEEEVAIFTASSAVDPANAPIPTDSATDEDSQNSHWVADSINASAQASRNSFRYVEKQTFSLLTGKPILAIGIFVVAGLMAAYMSGFFFLEGYIENWNPVENDMIPYWDDAEIHTIERALPPEA